MTDPGGTMAGETGVGFPAIDLAVLRRIHVVGAGGAGMSAIASVLAAMGHTVSGSDVRASPSLERLRAAGASVVVGHRGDNVGQVDAVAISSAVGRSNPEVVAAIERGVPVLSRADILAAICATRRTVAVAGTHGKTTTASMLALVLVEAGVQPSFIIGGELNEIGTGAVWDSGEWLVVEADESDGTFLRLDPDAGVLTSVEPDHLEYHGSFEALVASFDRFLGSVGGPRVVCADDPTAAALAATHGAYTYGTSAGARYRMVAIERSRARTGFDLELDGERLGRLQVSVPGLHNARNAAGASVVALRLGARFEHAERALARFAGVSRRFQFRGSDRGVSFIDDYAHLPGEVAAALATARDGGWERVVCVFQPHRYSRTATLWADFADSFTGADQVVVCDIYPAGEEPRPGVTGALVARAVAEAHPTANVTYLPTRTDVLELLSARLLPGDVCLTLGAGDLTTLADELMAHWRTGG